MNVATATATAGTAETVTGAKTMTMATATAMTVAAAREAIGAITLVDPVVGTGVGGTPAPPINATPKPEGTRACYLLSQTLSISCPPD